MNTKSKVFKIFNSNRGKIFTPIDIQSLFIDLSISKIEKTLDEMAKNGIIKRLIHNEWLFVMPEYNFFSGKTDLFVDIDDLVKQFAKSKKYLITYCELKALNLVGLSTQIVMKPIYSWTGPPNIIKFNSTKIELKHIDKIFISDISIEFSILLQAIRGINTFEVGDLIPSKSDIVLILSDFAKKYVPEYEYIASEKYQLRFSSYPDICQILLDISCKKK